jgi:hypothetical protein
MLADFERWLIGLLGRSQLTITSELRETLLQENKRLCPKDEDVRRHLRKGQPGDYKEKLAKDTVDYLNRNFASFLEEFGYVRM